MACSLKAAGPENRRASPISNEAGAFKLLRREISRPLGLAAAFRLQDIWPKNTAAFHI
ncbi:hypothetical protein SGRA_1522 [Saprospira grandis str. Lewin]|uniref:Uncharacterized protein n=1 Tax=Saprospira grandis (strain Lewin) TaxID=984262 RepID=H6L985_SAPGL|nr:hypothetical protein SGRA_1522 [Saprospira grandis str. Lewin]